MSHNPNTITADQAADLATNYLSNDSLLQLDKVGQAIIAAAEAGCRHIIWPKTLQPAAVNNLVQRMFTVECFDIYQSRGYDIKW